MHITQRNIIDSLRSSTAKSFAVIQSDVAETSDNLTYHLQKLLEAGFLVSPNKGLYKLNDKGMVYLNNNYDLEENHLFPTLSCMLVLRDVHNDYLLMRKRKQPFLGSLHFLTFGITSDASLKSQIQDFFKTYRMQAKNVHHELVYRKTAAKDGQRYFDKFFTVYSGELETFESEVGERQFMKMSAAQLAAEPTAISPTKEVVEALSRKEVFVERTFDEVK